MSEAGMTGAANRLREAVRALGWYLRQVSGEAKWDDYLDRCREAGVAPLSRRDFERHRAEHRERRGPSRCC